MDFKVSNVDNLVRICLDAPYLDGISNIKAALQPIDEKITYAIDTMKADDFQHRIIDLSKRAVQFAVGVILLIPGINIVIDFAIRYFSGTNLKGIYEPSEKKIASSHLDDTVLNSILPKMLEFLRANGKKDASIEYNHQGSGPLEFKIHIQTGSDLVVQMPGNLEHSEKSIFAELKKKAILHYNNIRNESYLNGFNNNDPAGEDEYYTCLRTEMKQKILAFMGNLGIKDREYVFTLKPLIPGEGQTGIRSYEFNIELYSERKLFLKFHRIMQWGSTDHHNFQILPQQLLEELISEVAVHAKTLEIKL